MKNIFFILTALLVFSVPALAQDPKKEQTPKKEVKPLNQDSINKVLASTYKYDALAPSKAAFYSAMVPGLGQIYNRKYWKAPLVWGGLAISMYSFSWNNTQYNMYRDAYKQLLAGHELTGNLEGVSGDRLIRAQKFHQRNRDLSALVTAGIYILNIVDANVDAHLRQFNVNENLTFTPSFEQNKIDYQYNLGVSMTYRF
ncbi:DUF5683 domain-containing protein [Flavobacterium sp. RHBU_3]|uniref:DUF5683 domain-containing protein n=1 Tax=Flavobacterium sp. RHBU_3 TaxID=3391184 RepID=UPI0039855CC3